MKENLTELHIIVRTTGLFIIFPFNFTLLVTKPPIHLAHVDVSVPVGHLAAALQLALGKLAIIFVQRSKEEQSVARKLSFVEHALKSSIRHTV